MKLHNYEKCPETVRITHGIKQNYHTLFETTDILVCYSELDVGEELPVDKHGLSEVVFRLEGTTRHFVRGEEYIIEEGTVSEIPAFVEHSCKVEGDKKVRQIILLAKNQIFGDFFEK